MKQYVLTSSAGQRLIAKALALHPDILSVLKSGTLVIIAGTTNGYIAEEILASIGQAEGFDRRRFFRGIILPPSRPTLESGMLADDSGFPGDVVIVKGTWQKGKTIFDVTDDLKEGDLILKGANALDIVRKRAAILIGHPTGGTVGASLQVVTKKRIKLMLPVGLEKRVDGDLDAIAEKLNAPSAKGPRFWPISAPVFTELDAIESLTGTRAELIAGGGVCGAEGSIRLLVSGTTAQMNDADSLMKSILSEPPFQL